MQEEKSTGLRNLEAEKALSLECLTDELLLPANRLECADSTSIRYIDGLQLRDILEGKYDATYDNRLVIDCRFAYEYAGGHIRDAENHWTRETIDTLLFSNPPSSNDAILVLHCEYSECRAPRMYVSA
jgi:hypothetical protein